MRNLEIDVDKRLRTDLTANHVQCRKIRKIFEAKLEGSPTLANRGETTYAPPPAPTVDPKPIRDNAKKGLKDALKTRIAKAESEEHKLSDGKLIQLVHDVEGELYRLYKVRNTYRV